MFNDEVIIKKLIDETDDNKIQEFINFEITLMKRLIKEANIHIRKTYPNPKLQP